MTVTRAHLEILSRLDELGGEVTRVEGRRDEDIGVDNVLLEVRVLTLL